VRTLERGASCPHWQATMQRVTSTAPDRPTKRRATRLLRSPPGRPAVCQVNVDDDCDRIRRRRRRKWRRLSPMRCTTPMFFLVFVVSRRLSRDVPCTPPSAKTGRRRRSHVRDDDRPTRRGVPTSGKKKKTVYTFGHRPCGFPPSVRRR